MIDLQVVHLRELVPMRDISAVAVIQQPVPQASGAIAQVYLDQVPTGHLVNGAGNLLIAFPAHNNKQSGWEIAVDIIDNSGVTAKYYYPAAQTPLLVALLRIVVDKASIVEEVWINKQQALFVVLTDNALLVELPSGVVTLDSLDIVAQAPTVQKSSLFSYLLADHPKSVTGTQKLVGQYVKLLQTSQGSDVLHPTEGGGLQSIIGVTNVTISGDSTLAARVMQAINQTTAQIIIGQVGRNIPSAERLMTASIGQVTGDKNDPTVVSVSLRIETFAKQAAFFDMFFGPGLSKAFV